MQYTFDLSSISSQRFAVNSHIHVGPHKTCNAYYTYKITTLLKTQKTKRKKTDTTKKYLENLWPVRFEFCSQKLFYFRGSHFSKCFFVFFFLLNNLRESRKEIFFRSLRVNLGDWIKSNGRGRNTIVDGDSMSVYGREVTGEIGLAAWMDARAS